MEIKKYFGDILELKKRLAAWEDLPLSVVIDEKSPKDISLIFGNYSDKEVIDFFETNFHSSYRHIIGYKQEDGYGDILVKCDYKSILYFEGIGDKVYAYSSDMTVLLKNRLYEVEEFSRFYVRISKSFVVNILAVEKILPALNGKILIALSDGQELVVTRKYKKQFLEYLEA